MKIRFAVYLSFLLIIGCATSVNLDREKSPMETNASDAATIFFYKDRATVSKNCNINIFLDSNKLAVLNEVGYLGNVTVPPKKYNISIGSASSECGDINLEGVDFDLTPNSTSNFLVIKELGKIRIKNIDTQKYAIVNLKVVPENATIFTVHPNGVEKKHPLGSTRFTISTTGDQEVHFLAKWKNEKVEKKIKVSSGGTYSLDLIAPDSSDAMYEHKLQFLWGQERFELICSRETGKSKSNEIFKKCVAKLNLEQKNRELAIEKDKKERELAQKKLDQDKRMALILNTPSGQECSKQHRLPSPSFDLCVKKLEDLRAGDLKVIGSNPLGIQCYELGFKPKTEGFANCQLQLLTLQQQQNTHLFQQRAYQEQQSYYQNAKKDAEIDALLGLANFGLNMAAGNVGSSRVAPVAASPNMPSPPPPPMRIITPSGNAYSCGYQGSALRCR